MYHYLHNKIASYTAWRKGVLLIAPLEILLILVVAGLLVMTFIVSQASPAGKLSIAVLKKHLQGLLVRLANPGTIDPEAERSNMEVLLNKVKATCEQPVISGNQELRELFGQTQAKMQAMEEQHPSKPGAWQQFKSVTNSFHELYFPARVA